MHVMSACVFNIYISERQMPIMTNRRGKQHKASGMMCGIMDFVVTTILVV